MKNAKKALRRTTGVGALGPVQQDMIRGELWRIKGEVEKLQEEADAFKVVKELAKEMFEQEAKKDENSKAFGQPIRKKIEQIIKKHGGIDKGAAFGGDLQGNACRKLKKGKYNCGRSQRAYVFARNQSYEGCWD